MAGWLAGWLAALHPSSGSPGDRLLLTHDDGLQAKWRSPQKRKKQARQDHFAVRKEMCSYFILFFPCVCGGGDMCRTNCSTRNQAWAAIVQCTLRRAGASSHIYSKNVECVSTYVMHVEYVQYIHTRRLTHAPPTDLSALWNMRVNHSHARRQPMAWQQCRQWWWWRRCRVRWLQCDSAPPLLCSSTPPLLRSSTPPARQAHISPHTSKLPAVCLLRVLHRCVCYIGPPFLPLTA